MSEVGASIFTPANVGAKALKNRLAVAPMTRVSAGESGAASEAMARYYERFAKGGFGLVITEGAYTDQAYSQGYPYQPGISDDAQARAWTPIVDRLHAAGASTFLQIMHAGALSQGNRFRDRSAAPSAIQPRGTQMAFYYGNGAYPVPKAMSDEEIADAVAEFGNAARRAVALAGFDGVEIHGANGYLLDQFLTNYTNERRDRWGGSIRDRMRLISAVLSCVKEAISGAAPVGVRISQGKVNHFTHKWAEEEEAAEEIFGTLSDIGADFIHVTEFDALAPAFAESGPSLISLTRRYAPNTSVIANGGLDDRAKIAQALDEGADIVSIGRGALANPDLPRKMLRLSETAPFDSSILEPIANIKPQELEMAAG